MSKVFVIVVVCVYSPHQSSRSSLSNSNAINNNKYGSQNASSASASSASTGKKIILINKERDRKMLNVWITLSFSLTRFSLIFPLGWIHKVIHLWISATLLRDGARLVFSKRSWTFLEGRRCRLRILDLLLWRRAMPASVGNLLIHLSLQSMLMLQLCVFFKVF